MVETISQDRKPCLRCGCELHFFKILTFLISYVLLPFILMTGCFVIYKSFISNKKFKHLTNMQLMDTYRGLQNSYIKIRRLFLFYYSVILNIAISIYIACIFVEKCSHTFTYLSSIRQVRLS